MSTFQRCTGQVCMDENPKGLIKTGDSFAQGSALCFDCAAYAGITAAPPPPPPAAIAKPIPNQPPENAVKTCYMCKVSKSLEDFTKAGQCKACKKILNIRYKERRRAKAGGSPDPKPRAVPTAENASQPMRTLQDPEIHRDMKILEERQAPAGSEAETPRQMLERLVESLVILRAQQVLPGLVRDELKKALMVS